MLSRICLTTATALVILFASGCPALPVGASPEQVWLAVSDVHLDIFDRSARASPYGFDSNRTLFESTVAQMKRTVPNPTVVLISGDLLMHSFRNHVGRGPAEVAGVESMRWIAATLGRNFPRSQFAIALGNNDIPCGDYRSAAGSRYLAQLARVWNPLVDRGGASPNFETSFLHGGYYTATLPVHGLHLVVLNTVLFSTEYRGDCRGGSNPAPAELAWFTKVLRDTPAGERNVVLMHIPPGFDAFATQYVHDFIAWPFLRPRYNGKLLGALVSSSGNVLYAIAGHTHRFDFRLAGGVPIVVFGALSPIYYNNPSYYALRLARDGSLRDIDLYPFDETRQEWLPAHSFDQTWGLQSVNGSSLARLHARIAASSDVRAAWNRQASGWSSGVDDSREPWGTGWKVAWCAQEVLASRFAACAGIGRRQGLAAFVFLPLVALAILVLILASHRRLRT